MTTCVSGILTEPSLEEILAEPIIQLVMQRDGVRTPEMRRTLDRLQDRWPSHAAAM